jgi:CRP/FNR family transcriptional regulator, anaerobic regulatory protein
MSSSHKLTCRNCSLAQLCLPQGLKSEELLQLDKLNLVQKTYQKGQHLVWETTPFSMLFTVRSGTFKSYKSHQNNQAHITGFYFPGELIGFESLHSKHYSTTIIALETSSVCEINYDMLLKTSTKIPKLQKQLFQLMSQKLCDNMIHLSICGAEQRIALFLLSISKRFMLRGFSSKQFHLSMSRQDIGNYLGLATETVSRILSQFSIDAIVEVKRRDITLKDIDSLCAIANNIKH